MKKSVPKKYPIKKTKITSSILTALDIILAILIITTSYTLVKTQLGKASIIFGFIMLALTTSLKIAKKF